MMRSAEFDPVGMKQRRSAGALESVHGEAVNLESQVPEIEVKRTHFHARAGALLESGVMSCGAEPLLAATAG